MTNPVKILLGIAAVLILGALIYFGLANGNGNPNGNGSGNGNGNGNGGVSFSETGNLVRNNPGLKPDVWYLVYEESGQPALNAELRFTNDSMCVTGEDEEVCDTDDFTQGDRVRVVGEEDDDVVTVETMTFLDEGGPNGDDEMIRVTTPEPYATVKSPLTIQGEARGNWYFEASFPIKMLDADGKVLGTTTGEAQGDWMTEDFVPFKATLTYSAPTTETGMLVLEKDNPSGLPENADEIRIPVTFAQNERTVKLYYYDEDKDKDASGNVQCSRNGLVAVERKIPVTQTPIQDTIRLLLRGDLTDAEEARGISTEYPLSGFTLKGANLKDGHLTLEFNDPQNTSGGGSCRVGILWYQIEATVKQFPEVKSVSFIPEELFQP